MRILFLSLLCALASAAEKGQWVITSEPPGAMVSIDGTQVGRAPFVLKNLLPGEHLVEAKWPDGRTSASTERVIAGSSRVLKLLPRLAPPPAQPSPEPIPSEPAPTPSPEAAPAPEAAPPSPEAAPPSPAPVAVPPAYIPPTIVIVPAAPPPAPKPSIAEVKNDQPAAAKPKKFYKSALFWSSIVIAVGAIVTVGVGAGIAANQPNRYAIAKF